ncbi:transglutaminase-like domain-containing protein [Gudongella sp. DL1XJH-153]|uniref:transglutaminase-like domain-containing protein n=1 Tax=Gudongella sp. DL1XJH-153 TaxID=3409804 RepID=UPI003BB5B435
MTKFQRDPTKIAVNTAYLFMIFSLVRMFAVGMSLQTSIWIQIGIVIAIAIVIRFLVINPFYFCALMVLFIISAIIIGYFSPDFYVFFRDRLFSLVNNIINNISGVENISLDNRLPLWVILLSTISLFTGLVIFKSRNRLLIPVLYIPIFLIYWYSFYDQAFNLMVLFIFSYLTLLGYDSLLKSKPEENHGNDTSSTILYPKWMSVVISYSIIIAILAAILPGSTDYIRWSWLNQKVTSAFPAIQDLRSGESSRRVSGIAPSFDFSTTGFQTNPSQLGGPVIIDDTVVMTIRGDRVNYLRGNIRHYYTGNSWESDQSSYGTVENNLDFSGLTAEEKESLYREVNFSITNDNFSSTTIFSPLVPSSYNIEQDAYALVNNDHSIIYPGGIYTGESYFIRAYTPRAHGIQVERGADSSLDDLVDLETYLGLPETITNRTIQLTNDITGEEATPLDKAIAIEEFLRNNYSYNLNVLHPPEGSDFVDHFLFDEEQGYCTYFASALTVMLRIEGIPARYVEGFIVGPASDDDIQEVLNSNAHTWVEAFIEPVGWMIFEPTPAYPLQARLIDYNPTSEEDIESADSQGFSRDPESAEGRDENGGSGTDDGPDGDNFGGQNSLNIVPLFALWVMIVITLILAWKLFKGTYQFINKKKIYSNYSSRDKLLFLYEKILLTIISLGYDIKPGETHFEYSNRISHKFHDYDRFGFRQATNLFVKTKYGTYSPEIDDIKSMESYFIKLDGQLKRHMGFIPYYLNKIGKLIGIKN